MKTSPPGLLVVALVAAFPLAAQGAERCVVADPSGTPLNVRAAPHGRILGALSNGARLTILDYASDDAGRRWVYVTPRAGKSGWVFRDYLDCGGF